MGGTHRKSTQKIWTPNGKPLSNLDDPASRRRIPYKTKLVPKLSAPLENFKNFQNGPEKKISSPESIIKLTRHNFFPPHSKNFNFLQNDLKKKYPPRIPYKTNLAQKKCPPTRNFQKFSKRPREKLSSQNPL